MGQPTDTERAALQRDKAASVAQLLFKAARLVNEEALVRVRTSSGLDVRAAHTTLLPHIDLDGTRLTELARRVGISKQAALQLVDELEGWGVLERVDDPADGRAKLIRFAHRRGRLSLFEGLSLLRDYERELEQALGERRWKGLRAGLTALLEVLEVPDQSTRRHAKRVGAGPVRR